MEQLIDLDVDYDISTEIEKEIELEMMQYEYEINAPLRNEYPLELKQFKSIVTALKTNPAHYDRIIALKEQLNSYRYGINNKFNTYSEIFNEPIFGTESFFNICQQRFALPIFHRVQRPPKQILVVKSANGPLRWLLLSQHEAQSVQKHLVELYNEDPANFADVWLIQPDGSLLAKGAGMQDFLKDEPQVLKGLLEINAFAGHVDYLDDESNREDTERWLAKNAEDKIHYLKLKTFRQPAQQQLLCTSAVIAQANDKNQSKTLRTGTHFFCKKRLQWEKDRQGNFRPEQAWKTKLLSNTKDIGNLNSYFVPFLGLDPDGLDDETKQALQELEKTEHLTGEALRSRAEELTQRQFNSLSAFQCAHLTPQQMRWLPVKKIAFLALPEQIHRKLTNPDGSIKLDYLLNAEQVKGLEESQSHLIPFVNPDYYRSFDQPWQIQSIPDQFLSRMKPEQGYMLSVKQIKALTTELCKDPTQDPTFFNAMMKSLTPDQLSWIPGPLLEKIPVELLIHVKEPQIKEITSPELISKLETIAASTGIIPEGTWTGWISPDMVPMVDAHYLRFLKLKEQIVKLQPEQIPTSNRFR